MWTLRGKEIKQTLVIMSLQFYLLILTPRLLISIPRPDPALIRTHHIKCTSSPFLTPITRYLDIVQAGIINPFPSYVDFGSFVSC
jgi:amino acid permease